MNNITTNPDLYKFIPQDNHFTGIRKIELNQFKSKRYIPLDTQQALVIRKLKRQEPELTFIFEDVCRRAKMSTEEVKKKTRDRNIVEIRQIYFKCARELTSKSFEKIGMIVNKDHATVMYGIKTVNNVKELRDRYNSLFPIRQHKNPKEIKLSIPIRETVIQRKSPFIQLEAVNDREYSGYREHQL